MQNEMIKQPLQLLRAVEQAKMESPCTWRQRSAYHAAEEWWGVGAPQLFYKDTLTSETYINPGESWRLSEVMHPFYTAHQLLAAKHPQLTDILNDYRHKNKDWAGLFGKEKLDSITAENTGWSLLEHFEPDYEWHWENAGLCRDEVDTLWRFMSVQLCQSVASSITGGNAKGMFVLISNGGQGKSTFVEAMAQVMQSFVFQAFEAKGLTIPEGTSITCTDNMAGSTPDPWALRRMFLNSICTYFTEKANYLTDNSTLDLFKGITAGAELEFRLMHSTETQRGRQRATAFLDFNPAMVNSLLSGKLADDPATARRFMCFYIKEANKEAWQPTPTGGFLKLAGEADTTERFWKHVKYCAEQTDVIHGVIAPGLQGSFERLVKALAARSATSYVTAVRSQLQEESRLLVDKAYLESRGLNYREINKIGASAIKDLIHIPKDRNDRFCFTLNKVQQRLKQTDWIVLKEGWDKERVKKAIVSLFQSTCIDSKDNHDVRMWLMQLEWQEIDGVWQLVSQEASHPYLSVVAS